MEEDIIPFIMSKFPDLVDTLINPPKPRNIKISHKKIERSKISRKTGCARKHGKKKRH